MEKKFGSSMAHLSVIESKFQVISWGAPWPGFSHSHSASRCGSDGSTGFQYAEKMSLLTLSPPSVNVEVHTLTQPHRIAIFYIVQAWGEELRCHIYSANLIFHLNPSILFYIILIITPYCCDLLFSFISIVILQFLFLFCWLEPFITRFYHAVAIFILYSKF